MKEVKPAEFRLESYQIKEFSLTDPASEFNVLDLRFDPSGIFREKNSAFRLKLEFSAYASKEETEQEDDFEVEEVRVISAVLFADFKFAREGGMSVDEIPEIFYSNSLGIIFPYLRAFVSTLTLQANVKMMLLPTLNLTNLNDKLKGNTKVVKSE
ncbi:MAG: hypothetical protein EOO69_12840 [Moraxellaceae bacterium]|nr:MAG: hypothetical protein EOO69_12840 [Moraxellaceae bacterium]